MVRLQKLYLEHYRPLLRGQGARPPARPLDGHVQVWEQSPTGVLRRFCIPPLFQVRTPEYSALGNGIPCTREDCRRWEEAGAAYAAVVDDMNSELQAVWRQHGHARWWVPGERRRAKAALEEMEHRYAATIQLASDAYDPVRQEIERGIRDERRRQAARREELDRQWREFRSDTQNNPTRGNPTGGTGTGGTGGFSTSGGF